MAEPIRCFEGSARPHERFWRARNGVETGGDPEIELYGVISEYSWMDDEVTPKMFKDDLYSVGQGGPVTVRINSPGGDVFAASVIRATLLDYPGYVTTRIDGVAASAAVAVALAGKTVQILDSAYMMIHDPAWAVFFAVLDIKTLGSMLDGAKALKEGLISSYENRTGISRTRLAKMMSDETWMSSGEAVSLGFADEMIEGPKAPQSAALVNVLRSYACVPAALLAPPQTVPDEQDGPAALAMKQAADRLHAKVKVLR